MIWCQVSILELSLQWYGVKSPYLRCHYSDMVSSLHTWDVITMIWCQVSILEMSLQWCGVKSPYLRCHYNDMVSSLHIWDVVTTIWCQFLFRLEPLCPLCLAPRATRSPVFPVWRRSPALHSVTLALARGSHVWVARRRLVLADPGWVKNHDSLLSLNKDFANEKRWSYPMGKNVACITSSLIG